MKARTGIFRRAIRTTPAVVSLVVGMFVNGSCSHFAGITTTQPPIVSLPANLPFGSIPQGVTSPAMTVTLMNTGKGSLTFTSKPTVTGTNFADFAISSATCSTASPVPGGSSCTVTLKFTPSTVQAESASLVFADNATPNMQTVSLTGTGTPPAPVVMFSPASLMFGPIAQGMTSQPLTVTLTNIGNAPLIFSGAVTITGPNLGDFTIVNVMATTCGTGFQVGTNSTCTVQVTFTPSTSNGESATLNFNDNANPSMQTVPLSGGSSSSTNNTATLTVESGPVGGAINRPFTSVTVCVPGSSVNCQTIDHIVVDTGSTGLRIISSVLTVSLPQATDSSGNPLANCIQFADGSYAFGPVQTADVKLAGEKASSVPIQVIAPPGFAVPPVGMSGQPGCAVSGGTDLNSVSAFNANGIIGVGLMKQDCGQACANAVTPPFYYICPNNICSSVAVPLASQVQNVVALFPVDNQGVLISLPAVGATGSATVTGSLIFGIGTQSDNVLGAAQVITTDVNGTFTATYNGQMRTGSYIDSGSNGLFFLDTTITGLPGCNSSIGFYCPNSSVAINTTITGQNNVPVAANFSVANLDALITANPSFAAFSNAGGPSAPTLLFDYGLPFFYGRNIFTCIEGQVVGTATGPFFAY